MASWRERHSTAWPLLQFLAINLPDMPMSHLLSRHHVYHCLALLVITSWLSGCGDSTGVTEETVQPSMTITVARAELQQWPRTITVPGRIAPWQEAVISAYNSGLPLVEVGAEVGDRVHRGAVLARFDDRSVRAELAQAEAQLAQARAEARLAEADHARAKVLHSKGVMNDRELEAAAATADAARAREALGAALVEQQQIRLAETVVRAADDGVIASRTASLGQTPAAGTELFRLIRQERLEWRAELTAEQLAQLAPGRTVELSPAGSSLITGTVRQLAPALEEGARLGIAYVDLPPGTAARAGMYASGTILLDDAPALAVPAGAVVVRDGRSAVFVVSDEQRVTRVPVRTGRSRAGFIEITDGLAAGAVVAVRGAGFLADGDLVRVADSPVVLAAKGTRR
jgi:RND family efflux transporter MFP subunit